MSEIPGHWTEWTRTFITQIKPDLTLAGLSFTVGEVITEEVSRGAREFFVKIQQNQITIVANKGGLREPVGYDPGKLYRNLFE